MSKINHCIICNIVMEKRHIILQIRFVLMDELNIVTDLTVTIMFS